MWHGETHGSFKQHFWANMFNPKLIIRNGDINSHSRTLALENQTIWRVQILEILKEIVLNSKNVTKKKSQGEGDFIN